MLLSIKGLSESIFANCLYDEEYLTFLQLIMLQESLSGIFTKNNFQIVRIQSWLLFGSPSVLRCAVSHPRNDAARGEAQSLCADAACIVYTALGEGGHASFIYITHPPLGDASSGLEEFEEALQTSPSHQVDVEALQKQYPLHIRSILQSPHSPVIWGETYIRWKCKSKHLLTPEQLLM